MGRLESCVFEVWPFQGTEAFLECSSGEFAHLIQVIRVAVKAVIGTVVQTEQPVRERLKNEGLSLLSSIFSINVKI